MLHDTHLILLDMITRIFNEITLYRLLTLHVTNLISHFPWRRKYLSNSEVLCNISYQTIFLR
jgi:hypothetical protein